MLTQDTFCTGRDSNRSPSEYDSSESLLGQSFLESDIRLVNNSNGPYSGYMRVEKALCHEGVQGSGCIDPYFLDLGTSGRWVVSLTPRRLYPRERAPDIWKGGWVEPRACLDDVEKRKSLTLPGLEIWALVHSARSQSLYRLHYPGSLVYKVKPR
jgi:hypothetical protein